MVEQSQEAKASHTSVARDCLDLHILSLLASEAPTSAYGYDTAW